MNLLLQEYELLLLPVERLTIFFDNKRFYQYLHTARS